MSLTLDAKTYNNDVARTSDIYRYLGPAHTASFNDMVDLYRTAAGDNANGLAKSKGRFKLSRSATDGTDQLLTDLVVDINVSIPADCVGTEIDSVVDDVAAYMATTAFKNLVKSHIINQT